MRTVLAALGVLCFMGSCSSGMTSSKGIVCDADHEYSGDCYRQE